MEDLEFVRNRVAEDILQYIVLRLDHSDILSPTLGQVRRTIHDTMTHLDNFTLSPPYPEDMAEHGDKACDGYYCEHANGGDGGFVGGYCEDCGECAEWDDEEGFQ